MATRDTLLKRVARRTGRSGAFGADLESTSNYDSEFTQIVFDAFDSFLQEVCIANDYREMHFDETISVTADDVSVTLPSLSETGWSTTIYHVDSIYLQDSGATYIFTLKTLPWLNSNYPDRTRTGASTGRPRYGTLVRTTMQLNIPSDGSYTIKMATTHMPDEDLFSTGTTATSNPIPPLDTALVAYAAYEIFNSVGMSAEADREFVRAYSLASQVALKREQHTAKEIRAYPRGFGGSIHPDPDVMPYDEDGLYGYSGFYTG